MGRPFTFHNLTGKRFGQLTVLSKWERRTRGSRTRTYWHVLCDCGKQDAAQEHHLMSGHKRSCGCLFDSTEEYGVADLRARFRSYRARAQKRQLAFELDIQEFQRISSQPCHYCGSPAVERWLRKSRDLNGGSIFNGIDRVDSNCGYNLTNCVSCCPTCNYMKGDTEYFHFIDQCYRIAEEGRRKPCCFSASSLPQQ